MVRLAERLRIVFRSLSALLYHMMGMGIESESEEIVSSVRKECLCFLNVLREDGDGHGWMHALRESGLAHCTAHICSSSYCPKGRRGGAGVDCFVYLRVNGIESAR